MKIRILNIRGDTVIAVSSLEEARRVGGQLAAQGYTILLPPSSDEEQGEVIDLTHISEEDWRRLAEADAVALAPVQGG